MEWQRCQRARRHDLKTALVLHQLLDRTLQRRIQLVGARKIERPGVAGPDIPVTDLVDTSRLRRNAGDFREGGSNQNARASTR